MKWVNAVPDKPSQTSKWKRITSKLQSRPGSWALVHTGKSQASAHSRAFQLRKRGLEVAVRGHEVYARAVPVA